MAQVGLHALTGLLVGKQFLSKLDIGRVEQQAIMYGYALGNVIPDLDYLAVVTVYPIDPTFAMGLHRGFSHSLLAVLALLIGFSVASWLMDDRYLRYLGYGLAAGVATHMTLDILIWFSPVDVFWPLGALSVVPPVNLWAWFQMPAFLSRTIDACEIGAFGLYYTVLANVAVALRTNLEMLEALKRMAIICWVTWAALTVLSLTVPTSKFDIYTYIPMGIIFMPSCLYLTWRMQETIEHVALPPSVTVRTRAT